MIRVVAAIIEEDVPELNKAALLQKDAQRQGRLLICKRAPGGAFPGKWEFPGGKINIGETPETALQRELREELGVETHIGDLIHQLRHRYPEMTQEVELTFFYAEIRSGTPRNLCFEEISWVYREELPRYDFLEADRFVVTRLSLGIR